MFYNDWDLLAEEEREMNRMCVRELYRMWCPNCGCHVEAPAWCPNCGYDVEAPAYLLVERPERYGGKGKGKDKGNGKGKASNIQWLLEAFGMRGAAEAQENADQGKGKGKTKGQGQVLASRFRRSSSCSEENMSSRDRSQEDMSSRSRSRSRHSPRPYGQAGL